MTQTSQTPTTPDRSHSYQFSHDEICRYRGCWVAFSPDGGRLIAGSPTLAALDMLVRSAGEDPEEVLLELVPESDYVGSGTELS